MSETSAGQPATAYELRGPAAWIQLTRPEKMNAMDPSVIEGIGAGLDRAREDRARAIVLTGSGTVFCAGADLKHLLRGRGDLAGIDRLLGDANALIRRIAGHPAPVVAAVNGAAVAGGLELVLACDLVIAAEDATLFDGHANFGLFPGGGSSVRLPRLMGPARAKHLLFTGRAASAQEMHELGVVNEVVPRRELEETVQSLCETLARRSPEMLARVKHLVNEGSNHSLDAALDLELDACRAHMRSADAAEGLAAFSEGRRPSFS